MSDSIFYDGQDKKVKFIEVNEKQKKLSVYFQDFTYFSVENVKIIVRKEEDDVFSSEWND